MNKKYTNPYLAQHSAIINLKVQTPGLIKSNKRPKSGEIQRKIISIKNEASKTELERVTLNNIEI